jgi:hypothetical protein
MAEGKAIGTPNGSRARNAKAYDNYIGQGGTAGLLHTLNYQTGNKRKA